MDIKGKIWEGVESETVGLSMKTRWFVSGFVLRQTRILNWEY
jgi:hypothetical protein